MPGYAQLLASAQTSGATNSGTSAVSLLPTGALYTIPGGALSIGSKLIIEAQWMNQRRFPERRVLRLTPQPRCRKMTRTP